VEPIYKKIDNIDEKVKEANMPYLQWKVLFLVGENANAEEISSLIEEDLTTVQEVLTSLESKALIEKVEESKSEVETEMQLEDATSPSIGDELLVEEEDVISQVDEQLDTPAFDPDKDIPADEEKAVTETEDVVPDLKEESSFEPEGKTEEDTISLDDSIPEENIAAPDISTLQEPEPSDQSSGEEQSEAESLVLQEDEFDLSLDEPETAIAEEPETEVVLEEPVEQKPDETESSDEEIISDSTKKTIMVIDDSIVIRKMIEIALEEEDYKIITAISGKEGLETIEKDKPNLVILDMMLPDMNGIEVLKTIKSDKNLPVIMLSGKDSPQLIETAKEVGVDDFLPKPFRDEELVEKVKTLIEV
jgi:CheY-like chemotaxis protein